MSLLGVGTVLCLGRNAWSMVKRLRQATNEYASPPPPPPGLFLDRLMPLCHPNIINVFSTNIAKRTIVMEKVSRDLQALLEDKRRLDNASGEQMVG